MRSRRSFLIESVSAAALTSWRAAAADAPPSRAPEHQPAATASETRRYRDAATENIVLRLTEPTYQSRLLPANARPFLQRGNGLMYVSDRGGSWQVYRLETRAGESKQMTTAAQLNTNAIALSPDERALYFIDGETLRQRLLTGSREHTVEQRPSGWENTRSLTVSDDGGSLAIVDERPGHSRLRTLPARTPGPVVTRLEIDGTLADVAFRPRSGQLSYRRDEGTLWLLSQNKPEQVGQREGRIGQSLWSADGQSLLYLHYPPQGVHTIREYLPESKEDRLVAPTSQFVQFARNADSNVFIGLSGSKASPYVLLLVRKGKRELTLCEHRDSDPAQTPVLISPSSQRIYFETDRFGKRVLMSMVLERLVENTSPE